MRTWIISSILKLLQSAYYIYNFYNDETIIKKKNLLYKMTKINKLVNRYKLL